MREEHDIELKRSQMRKGLLEFCILLVISSGRVYSSDILKHLKKANLLVVEGTLYPLLSRLKAQELLTYDWEESKSGPPRKYYELTKKGRDTLHGLEETWSELHESISTLEPVIKPAFEPRNPGFRAKRESEVEEYRDITRPRRSVAAEKQDPQRRNEV